MALWAIPVGMAALGAYKGQQDRAQAKKDRLAEAEVARWSPWTGMSPARVGMPAGELGGAIQGGLAGASLMQSFDGGGNKQPTNTGESWTGNELNNSQVQPTQQSIDGQSPAMLAQQSKYSQYGARPQSLYGSKWNMYS